MLEPPQIAVEALRAAVRAEYGLEAAALEFLPLGADAAAWVFRLQTSDGAAYLLKLRRGPVNQAGLLVPRCLTDQGVPHVLAPVATQSGQPWCAAEGFALMLYPFIAGRTGAEGGLSDEQWRAFGATLRQVHAAVLPPAVATQAARETFSPAGIEAIPVLAAHIAKAALAGQAERALAVAWRAHQAEIEAVAGLARALAQPTPPGEWVLCHADAHTWNVLVDEAGQIWLIDWDETMLAPRERDLMFVIGGISRKLVGPRQTEHFMAGYGLAEIDARLLAYYRAAWAVSDITAFARQILFSAELSLPDRQAAVSLFMSLFEPGEIVDQALAASAAR
ncbi:MAG: aminoglycoside phosphotransferase family protein [Anaerolineales bacterium]|nr:aminoglycoside phosphotransferase family protein [Anaerolineales bacterium]